MTLLDATTTRIDAVATSIDAPSFLDDATGDAADTRLRAVTRSYARTVEPLRDASQRADQQVLPASEQFILFLIPCSGLNRLSDCCHRRM